MAVKCVVLFCLLAACLAHIPEAPTYYEWAEPDSPSPTSSSSRLSRQASAERLSAVRAVLAARGVDAYIVPTADAHNSQYIAPAHARRTWVSGLSGSSGTAVVSATEARLWTDGRYFTQFDLQVDATLWTLMRQGTDATIQQWLTTLSPGSVVGVDPTTYTRSSWTPLEAALRAVNITLLAIEENLVDEARAAVGDPAPARPNNAIQVQPLQFSGRAASAKIADLVAEINGRGASALVLTALDEVAYTLNLRGSDIPYNPVFFAYLVIRADVSTNNVILFWDSGVLSTAVQQHLAAEGVSVDPRPYDQIFEYLRTYTAQLPIGSTIWLSQDGSEAIHEAVEASEGTVSLSTLSPVSLMKNIKNSVELEGFRTAHIKDGVAVVRCLRWLHQSVAAGEEITEMDVSDKLLELRSEEADFMGPSFETIAGAGENGAIIHYSPTREGVERVLRTDDMLLVDSGAQYRDGTTDITRTRHLGQITDAQRRTFTRVLQGQILMGTAVFPFGTRGHLLDTLARKALWEAGLNYAHGTSHGMGSYLNVHEGPSGIGGGVIATDPGITPGMIMSNEPGYYEVGEYGIRHEDVVEVIHLTSDSDHIYADKIIGDFTGTGAAAFYTISLAPHQTSSLDLSILTDIEIKFLNDYHARVLRTLGPILLERGLNEDYQFLETECAPIGRSAAILFKASPLLAVLTFVTVLVNKF